MQYDLRKFRYDKEKQHFEASRADLNNDFINSSFDIVNPTTGGTATFHLVDYERNAEGEILAWLFRSHAKAFTARIIRNSQNTLF